MSLHSLLPIDYMLIERKLDSGVVGKINCVPESLGEGMLKDTTKTAICALLLGSKPHWSHHRFKTRQTLVGWCWRSGRSQIKSSHPPENLIIQIEHLHPPIPIRDQRLTPFNNGEGGMRDKTTVNHHYPLPIVGKPGNSTGRLYPRAHRSLAS